jgi:hypothetical protein
MRPGVFWEAIHVWRKDKNDDRRHIAEVARSVGLRLFNLQLKPEDKIKDPRKFWELPWDKDDSDPELDRLNKLSKADRDKEARAFMDKINFGK